MHIPIRTCGLAAIVVALASACTTTPTAAPPPPAGCNPEAAGWAIGQSPDQDVVNRILHDTGTRDARVLSPTSPATMDYRPDRINVIVNDRGAITGLRCG